MLIAEVLKKLTDKQRAQLMYAFENDIAQFIEYKNRRYVGVHTEHIKNLRPEQTVGKWAEGEIKK